MYTFEIKLTAVSKSEILLGVFFDQGEAETKDEKWIPFTRLRLGIVFLIIDFVWF